MAKIVVFVDNGMVQDVITDGKSMEFLIVDFDRQTLDQSIVKVLSGPFRDIVRLADMYGWDAAYDPKRVNEIFHERKNLNVLGD